MTYFFADFSQMGERGPNGELNQAVYLQSGKCILNGEEIESVWYVDTRVGLLKTYDVSKLTAKEWVGSDVPIGGVFSNTLRGRIELFAADGRRLF